MFTTRNAVQETTGIAIDQATLSIAQMMIEAYIGKIDGDVVDAGDRALLGKAVTFQAIYINGQHLDMLEQVAVSAQNVGETKSEFNLDLMAPFMSPWAVMTCKNLSWAKTRTVHTGPIHDTVPVDSRWEVY